MPVTVHQRKKLSQSGTEKNTLCSTQKKTLNHRHPFNINKEHFSLLLTNSSPSLQSAKEPLGFHGILIAFSSPERQSVCVSGCVRVRDWCVCVCVCVPKNLSRGHGVEQGQCVS